MMAWYVVTVLGLTGKVRFFCQDETRIGLKTISGRKITARGVKPKAKVQWQFQATWLYGIVEPATGESFFYEFSHLNTDCFQAFLDLVSAQFADSIILMQVDQAGCHRAKRLRLPSNIRHVGKQKQCIEETLPFLSIFKKHPNKSSISQPHST